MGTLALAAYDNFTPRAATIRKNALIQNFGPQEYLGHTYNGIGLDYDPELVPEIEGAMGGNIDPVLGFFRLGLEDDKTTSWIHADISLQAKYAAILYLADPIAPLQGTAFWRNKGLGIDRVPDLPQGSVELAEWISKYGDLLNGESNEIEKWDLLGVAGMKFNRLVVYPGGLFHSRYPEHTWGKDKKEGRLTYNLFFNLRSVGDIDLRAK